MYKLFFKRLFDIVGSITGLIILSPILVITVLLLVVANKGNVFFLQKRPGRGERIFTIIKFKTMRDTKDQKGILLSESERITIVGKYIRKFSIDEIPQLINVLIGDMSLIGPRPLLTDYLLLYNDFQRKRHMVRPGITGWAQINGRNAVTWEERFKYDIYYVENISFSLDFKIIFKTFKKITGNDVSPIDGVVMERFNGNYE
ncbi:MAG: sugar transferase [Chitinophagales bacterium]|nr:sugar transferase [Chitinophagales bacterium]